MGWFLSWIKKHYKCILIIVGIVIIIAPAIVSVAYLIGKKYGGIPTDITADGVLSYIAMIFSATATIFIAIIAFAQTEKTNNINDRLLQIEEINSTPYIYIDEIGSKISVLCNELSVILKLNNGTSSPINVHSFSKLEIHLKIENYICTVPVLLPDNSILTILSHKSKEIFFTVNDKAINQYFINFLEEMKFSAFECSVTFKLNYTTSTNTYTQKVNFGITQIKEFDSFNIQSKVVYTDYLLQKV